MPREDARVNSPLQPSATQTLVSSYPHVEPRSHTAVPVERVSSKPLDVSAGQCRCMPGVDVHTTVSGTVCASRS